MNCPSYGEAMARLSASWSWGRPGPMGLSAHCSRAKVRKPWLAGFDVRNINVETSQEPEESKEIEESQDPEASLLPP